MSAEIQWGSPPGSRAGQRHRGEVLAFVEVLKTRPGAWARYPHTFSGGSTATHYRRRYPGTEWVSRIRPDRAVDLYGRWIGNGDDAA